jgi:enoyl-CoA hydratase
MDLEAAAALELNAFALCFATGDQKEGMKAFLEKRKAKFDGR